MGEAKRRQQAGGTGAGGAAEDFRVSDGMVAITLDIEACDPSTLTLSAHSLDDFMNTIAASLTNRSYHSVIQQIAREFPRARRTNEKHCEVLGFMAFWSAFNHPRGGKATRQAVSDALRTDGKAHITWRFGPEGLAIAVAGGFLPLANVVDTQAKAGKSVVVAKFGPRTAPFMH
jgi:hypothetical protein